MRNFLVFESQKLWFNIPGRENTMRNKSLIHTKDIKTQEGTPLHLEYYLINDSVLGGCAECYGVEILAQTGEAQCYAGIPRITMRGISLKIWARPSVIALRCASTRSSNICPENAPRKTSAFSILRYQHSMMRTTGRS